MKKSWIYKNNIAILDEKYSGFGQIIHNCVTEEDDAITVEIESAFDGSDIFVVKKDNRRLYLNQKRNPTKMAQDWVKQLGNLHRNTPIIICGLGNGVFLKQLVSDTDTTINIMVYEPSFTIFKKALEEIDFTEVFENRPIGLVVGRVNESEIEGILSGFIEYETLSYVKEFIHPNYDTLFMEETRDFFRKVHKRVSDLMVNRNTRAAFSTMFPDNFFHNICYLPDGYKSRQLADVIPRDIPAIVVAAGPSLNRNITDLRAAKGKAFIIAVDTAVKPLIRSGIKPDMIVIVDGEKPLKVMEVEEARKIPLLTSVSAAKDILEYHTGKKIFFNENLLFVNQMFYLNGLSFEPIAQGGSVSLVAFSLAYMIGINRIILVGQDLALTNNRTHADGTFHDKMEEIDTSDCLMVPGNCEAEVPSRGDLKHYIDWYGMYIEGCKKRRPLYVINATEGGARLEGTEIMALRDAIQQECHKEVDLESCFARLEPVLSKSAREKAVFYLHQAPTDLLKIFELAKKGEKQYKKLKNICKYHDVDERQFRVVLEEIKKITQEIESYPIHQVISSTLIIADYIMREERDLEEDSIAEEGREIARKGILIMGLTKDCAQLFKELAEETVAKVV